MVGNSELSLWESHVYEKTAAGWRIVHLHYSGQPAQS
jgi:hypothetical protein